VRAARAREHFERLQRSMDEIRLDNPHTVDEWIAIVEAPGSPPRQPVGATST
jgi:branched-subunit amino acid aminotransferase/4-amino-4-deoxychorismate lyase